MPVNMNTTTKMRELAMSKVILTVSAISDMRKGRKSEYIIQLVVEFPTFFKPSSHSLYLHAPMAEQSHLFKKKLGQKCCVLDVKKAPMAEWSNAPVWKAGPLTGARVRISFGASLLFFLRKKPVPSGCCGIGLLLSNNPFIFPRGFLSKTKRSVRRPVKRKKRGIAMQYPDFGAAGRKRPFGAF